MKEEVSIKLYVYAAGGLLIAAAIVSFLLDNWNVLIGVGLGLAMVIASDLAFGWSTRYSEETEKHRDGLVGKRQGETTYYYDEDGHSPIDSDNGSRSQLGVENENPDKRAG